MTTASEYGGGRRITEPEGDSLNFWRLVTMLMDGVRTLASFGLVTALAVVVAGLLAPRRFTTEVSFRPQSDAAMSGQLSSLAAQFGFSLPNGEGAESPDFYLELLDSRQILGNVALSPFSRPDGVAQRLDSLLEIDEAEPELRTEATIEWLREVAIRATADRNTGIVAVRVRTPWPTVTAQLASALLLEVDRFNAESRRTRASSEATFVASQVSVAEDGLRTAEEAMKRFLARNRRYAEAPDLVFEHDRLRRDVDMRQQLFTSLREALEQAKIATVRDTPVITIVQAPYVPPAPDSRWIVIKFLLGGLFGLSVGVVVVMLQRLDPPSEPEARATYERILRVLRIRAAPRST